jgi:hypothetical protein
MYWEPSSFAALFHYEHGTIRARSYLTPARSYISCLSVFSRLIWPFTGPLLQRAALISRSYRITSR